MYGFPALIFERGLNEGEEKLHYRKTLKILPTKIDAVYGFKSWRLCYMFFYNHLQYNFDNRNQKTLDLDILKDWDSLGVYNSVDPEKVISLAS